jgi:hypothetical protein
MTMTTAKLTRPKTKAAPDPEDQLASIEAIANNLPPSYGEVCEVRSRLQGQLEWARTSLRETGRLHGSRAETEAAKLRTAISRHEGELADVGTFSPAQRRDGAVKFLAHVPTLQQLHAEVHEQWAPLVECKARNALSSSEFAQHERLGALLTRIGTLIAKANILAGELGDLIPDRLLQERAALLAIAKQDAIPDSPVAGDVARRVQEWASDQLAALAAAVPTSTWASLEQFKVKPLP